MVLENCFIGFSWVSKDFIVIFVGFYRVPTDGMVAFPSQKGYPFGFVPSPRG